MRWYTRRQVLAGMAVGLAAAACGDKTFGNASSGPRASATTASPVTPAPCTESMGYMTFAINVHDWRHIDESADTLLRAISIFERQGVRGDFYLTGEMARLYGQKRPDVVERLKSSGMTISYHVRPPQPTYAGFDDALKKLDDAQLLQTVRDYETYRLDMATGGLIRSEAGGYSLVSDLFERPPVVASAQSSNARIRETVLSVYKSMGAKMAVFYHEEGTPLDRPFEWRNGLLARPSDFSITRWREDSTPKKGTEADKDPFWWNFMETPHADAYNPAAYLERRMSEWTAPRPAFVTSLIHENNFVRSGAESWTAIYFADDGKAQPKSQPYDLNAPDPSKLRSQAQQDAIWIAYEEMVAYAAKTLKVVTSEEIVALAAASGGGGEVAPYCAALTNSR